VGYSRNVNDSQPKQSRFAIGFFSPFFYFLNNKENEAENVYTSVQLFQPPLGGPLIKCGMLQQSAWSIRSAGLRRPHFFPSKSLEVATNGH